MALSKSSEMAAVYDEPLTGAGFGFQWHITDRCGGGCNHCYQLRTDGGGELSLDALKRIADDIMLTVSAPVTVNITGGEPLMYQYHGRTRGVFELMAHLSAFRSIGELNIITSGQGLDDSVIDDLKALPKLTAVKLSLESHNPKTNDAIRRRGHYDMALDRIRRLSEAGIPVIIMTTLSAYNYQSVAGLCALADALGVNGVIFERFVPLGRGAETMADCALISPQWREVLSAIAGFTGASIDELSPYKAFWVNGESVSGAPCCLGPASMALMPDGTVYPCRRVPTPIGKLPDDGMKNILKRLGGYSAHSQKCFDFDFESDSPRMYIPISIL